MRRGKNAVGGGYLSGVFAGIGGVFPFGIYGVLDLFDWLFLHPADPALAWPKGSRPGGPVLAWGCIVVLAALSPITGIVHLVEDGEPPRFAPD